MEDEKMMTVRVAVRCRPLVQKELNEGCQPCLTFIKNEPQLVLGSDKAFTYDKVFNADAPQAQVYEESVRCLVKGIFKGYNATVLAYGQTGSGKTFTMGGAYDTGVDSTLKGVIPRVITDLFEGISTRSSKYDFVVKVSYLEIYKEELCDLLIPVSTRIKDSVTIREDPEGGIRLAGLQERVVFDPEETQICLEKGALGRTTGSTSMNNTSSRSHAIFTIHVDWTNKEDSNDVCKAKFHLVDLAGSERAKRTHAEGERFKEGVNINKGLLALGNVISALGDETQKRSHIPYRDSKLTRLLQDSLGGNSNTVMIACVSPADSNIEETLSTLRYADRARKIKNKPIVNRDPHAAEIMRLKAVVLQLQNQVQENGGKVDGPVIGSSLNSSVDTKKETISRLGGENKKLRSELLNAVHQSQAMCEKMVKAETLNDELKSNLSQLKEKTGLSISLLEANPDIQIKIAEIHDQIAEMQTMQASQMDESPTLESEETEGRQSTGDANYTTEDVLKEAQLKNKMYALNDVLGEKEALLKQMNLTNDNFELFHNNYQAELTDRESQISELKKEKDMLTNQLHTAKVALNCTKVGEQRRQRVKELEVKIAAFERQNKEQAKLLRSKEASSKDSQRLASEISELKKQRVNLIKQMRAENEASRKWKQQKEKEVMQLKAKERRQQVEYQKMERKNIQQQTKLKRKGEEAAAANKRLKEALMKQKQALVDRNLKQERHDASSQARLKKWLYDEVELVITVEENRHHLEQMRMQRKDLTERLTQLTNDLLVPPTKRKLMYNNECEETDQGKQKTEDDIKESEFDLKHINSQITETQQRIIEADQEDKSKTRWEGVRTLMDARSALKLLLDKAVKSQMELIKETSKVVDAEAALDDKTQMANALQQELATMKEKHNRDLTTERARTQQRMAPLLTLLNQKVINQEGLASAGQLTQNELDQMASMQEELEKKTSEVDQLQKTLTKTNIKQRRGETNYFGHLQHTPLLNKNRTMGRIGISEVGTPVVDDVVNDPSWSPTKKERRLTHQLFTADSTTVDSLNTSIAPCKCKGDCSSKRCRCRKGLFGCTDSCKCSTTLCINRVNPEEQENVFTSTMNSTFLLDSTTSNSLDSSEPVHTEPTRPTLRRRSSVKRNSNGEPLVTLHEQSDQSNFPSIDSLDNSNDMFKDESIKMRKRTKVLRKPFFSDYS